jgi:hypothetical protein
MKPLVIIFLILALFFSACSNKDPCDPVAPTLSAQQLGLVLEGGLVCGDEEMILTVDYPNVENGETLRALYRTSLESQGWTVEQGQTQSNMLAIRGQTTIIIVAQENRERGVPTVIIRY